VRDVEFVSAPPENVIWRISTAPQSGPKLMAALKSLGGRHYYDWGGGLIWLSLPAPYVQAVRDAVKTYGGHATLIRAPQDVRLTEAVFQPLDPRLMALTASIKTSFDPEHKLNPGRMYSGL